MSSSAPRTGVVLMAYGTPGHLDEVEAYYTDIRRGRPPTAEALADLVGRYEAIGGVSPLMVRTLDQQAAVQAALDEIEPDTYTVVLGLKHASPSIESAVADMVAQGAERIVAAVLAPHYSEFSIGQYVGRVRAAAPEGVEVTSVSSWATEPEFIDFIARDLQRRLDAAEGSTRVLFTAHSLPERILQSGDPYPEELRATAELVARQLGLREGVGWQLAWQSAGRTPEPWIGPDILDVIEQIAGEGEVETVITSAVGFVADHLEVLYDLDIEARLCAESLGLRFDRTSCVNDDTSVMAALARCISAASEHDRTHRS